MINFYLKLFLLLCLPVFLTLGNIQPGRAETPPRSASTLGLKDLPLPLQLKVSESLGEHQAHYHLSYSGQSWQADNRGLKIQFSPLSPALQIDQPRPLILALEGFGYGEHLTSVGAVSPRVEANRIEYPYPGLTAWYINGPLGLQQGFILPQPPAGPAGAELRVVLGLNEGWQVVVKPGGREALFQNGSLQLHYSGLLAYDARGQELPAWLEVEAGRDLSLVVDDREATYPIVIDPLVQQAALRASNPGSDDWFGYSVAIDGDTAIVGARSEDSNGVGGPDNNSLAHSGAAYIFVREGVSWSQEAYLKAAIPGADDNFGSSVGISGDTVIVGAEQEDGNGLDGPTNNSAANAGAAYIFVREGGSWSQQAYLKAANAEAGDRFGRSVAISGETAIIGAYGETSLGSAGGAASFTGAAYIFVREGDSWSQQAYLKAANLNGGDRFGYSVAISGETAIVGAPGEAGPSGSEPGSNSAPGAGAAYIFVRSDGNWTQQAYLKAANAETGDQFGHSVALSGETAIVGAYSEDSGNLDDPGDNSSATSGAAYIFVRSGLSWSQQAYLKAANTEAGDRFGWSVAIEGDMAVVGATDEDSADPDNPGDNSVVSAGAAYVFVRSGTSWSQAAYLKITYPSTSDQLGAAAALSGNTAIVGASTKAYGSGSPYNTAYQAGAAFIFFGPSPEIRVLGNNLKIADEDNAPSLADHTDFGSADITVGLVTRTFTISNAGSLGLNLTGTPRVLIGGPNAADFTVAAQPSSSIGTGDSSPFEISFDPSAVGLRTATVTITNDDHDENPYNFTIQGTGTGVPEVAVIGNSQVIVDGDTTPSLADHTDFGSADVSSTILTRTFTISNSGNLYLVLLNLPRVSLSGPNAAEFTVTRQPGNLIQAGSSTTFEVSFNPTGVGLRSATVTIGSTDSDENPYEFVIQGLGTAAPEISLSGNGTDIADGDTTPSPLDHTDFGAADISSGQLSRIFTLSNSGNDSLSLTGTPRVLIGGPNATDFTVTAFPTSPLQAGGNTTFQIMFDPSAVGLRSATVSIANSDSDENPYNFAIQGLGTGAPEMEVLGNGQPIMHWDLWPTLANHTDFDLTQVAGRVVSRTFTIMNIGNVELTLPGTPKVIISGANAADFTVTRQPGSPLGPGNSTTFEITFAPLDFGFRSATVSIASSDSDENPYRFTIGGTGFVAPDINISGNGHSILSGDTTPSLTDQTDFGNVPVLGGAKRHTFTLSNTGSLDLTLHGTPRVLISGPHAADFRVSLEPEQPIEVGGSTTFEIIFDPKAGGLRTATVSLVTNDSDENPYLFTIRGTGTGSASLSVFLPFIIK